MLGQNPKMPSSPPDIKIAYRQAKRRRRQGQLRLLPRQLRLWIPQRIPVGQLAAAVRRLNLPARRALHRPDPVVMGMENQPRSPEVNVKLIHKIKKQHPEVRRVTKQYHGNASRFGNTNFYIYITGDHAFVFPLQEHVEL